MFTYNEKWHNLWVYAFLQLRCVQWANLVLKEIYRLNATYHMLVKFIIQSIHAVVLLKK